MISMDIQSVLGQLKQGGFDLSQTDELNRLSPDELIANLSETHPIVFQGRQIRDKSEIGVARKIGLETIAAKVPGSFFSRFQTIYSIRDCVLVGSYSQALSEITVLSEIRVRPTGGRTGNVTLKMGRGYKLDKTPDGWAVKPVKRRIVKLAESFLLARGWKFEVFGLFAHQQ